MPTAPADTEAVSAAATMLALGHVGEDGQVAIRRDQVLNAVGIADESEHVVVDGVLDHGNRDRAAPRPVDAATPSASAFSISVSEVAVTEISPIAPRSLSRAKACTSELMH